MKFKTAVGSKKQLASMDAFTLSASNRVRLKQPKATPLSPAAPCG
jgi:hypothetical protein